MAVPVGPLSPSLRAGQPGACRSPAPLLLTVGWRGRPARRAGRRPRTDPDRTSEIRRTRPRRTPCRRQRTQRRSPREVAARSRPPAPPRCSGRSTGGSSVSPRAASGTALVGAPVRLRSVIRGGRAPDAVRTTDPWDRVATAAAIGVFPSGAVPWADDTSQRLLPLRCDLLRRHATRLWVRATRDASTCSSALVPTSSSRLVRRLPPAYGPVSP